MARPRRTESTPSPIKAALMRSTAQAKALDEVRSNVTCNIPTAGRACGVGRDAAYRAAEMGEIPTIRLGRELVVPSAKLLELLGLPVPPELLGLASAEPVPSFNEAA